VLSLLHLHQYQRPKRLDQAGTGLDTLHVSTPREDVKFLLQELDLRRNSRMDNAEREAAIKTVLQQRTDWVKRMREVGDASLREAASCSQQHPFKCGNSIGAWLDLQREMKTAEQDRNRENRELE
jgi:hypothetical protein